MEPEELKDFLKFVMEKTLPLCENADNVVSDAAIKLNKKARELELKIERHGIN